MPPVLYLLSVSTLETYLKDKYEKELTNIYLSDMNNILSGLTPIKDAINDSITVYLKNKIFIKLGGQINVHVTTNQGNILYPATYQDSAFDNFSTDPAQQAEKNFGILNEGVALSVNIKILHYSFIAFALLLFYILIFLTGLYGYYRKISTSIQLDELRKSTELNQLHELQNKKLKEIDLLSEEKEALLSDYDQLKSTLKKEKSQADKTEEDLFEEIEALETKLKENDQLKEKIQELEKVQNRFSRQKDKAVEKLEKRFKTLYKNIEITHRALASLTDMTDEMSLKAEELIHQLNDDPTLVTVKRKVFSKKGKITSFEVIFAYNGRLYFRKTNDNRIKIPIIGSKNTQAKDLLFLEKN